ncbi:hypothetical protein [Pseudanabaena sp. PCC 6802]|uniref:hypothetical protein n=1 Tax=Pseudanabaena sp. PCC 6802 TaxID=118173 RepID=UPI00034CA3C4|nr:hypothetical protein [Pseudanabaena sp. PCC 6802]
MTLDKHIIKGIPPFRVKTCNAQRFEDLMIQAGYQKSGSGQGKGGRIKVWWAHPTHGLVEAIYTGDKQTVITAYPTSP